MNISLRKFTEDDSQRVLEIMGDDGQGMLKPSTLISAKDWIKNFPFDFFAVCDEQGQIVGEIHLEVIRHFDSAEVGYMTAKGFEGRGIASAALAKICEYGFRELALNRIFARTTAQNIGSTKALLKAGFIHEASLKEAMKGVSGYLDQEIYRLLRSEWSK